MGRVQFWLTVLISTVWTVSFTADLFLVRYEIPASVHAAMLLAAGGVFGSGVLTRNGNGKDGNGK